ncbi:ribosome small subunit-dependent GTPase A [Bacillus sp. BGMRC 2118]|nr:ribosome small subunit-dependent GTPase A [Bacillus sp. BGMRC 2118]
MSIQGLHAFIEEHFTEFKKKGYFPGRVIRKNNEHYTLLAGEKSLTGKVSGKFRYQINVSKDFPAVGDWVVCETKDASDRVTIHAVLPRRSCFSRKQPISGGRKIKKGIIDGGSTEEQVIAANIDLIFIVSGLDENFDLRRIERYITLTYNSGAIPVIILNKVDLCRDINDYVEQVKTVALDIPILPISAERMMYMEQLEPYLSPGTTVALLGSSGVGKSTITNFLLGEEKQSVGPTSKATGKGKHTTTSAELIMTPTGYMIIDTPGLRELQLWGDHESLDESFTDISELARQCKYTNCTHQTEPGCMITLAIEKGTLCKERYESYQKQYDELYRLGLKKKKIDIQLSKKLKQRRLSR